MNHGKIFNSLNTDIVLSCARIKTTPPSTHKHTHTRGRAHTHSELRALLSRCARQSRAQRVWRNSIAGPEGVM